MDVETAYASNCVPPPDPEFWLDLLMPEMCEHIAWFVIYSNVRSLERSDIVCLAQSSLKQGHIILNLPERPQDLWTPSWFPFPTQGRRLLCGPVTSEEIEKLPQVADESAKTMLLQRRLKSVMLSEHVIHQSLERVLTNQMVDNIQTLAVEMCKTDHTALMNCLEQLNLKRLQLVCRVKAEEARENKGCIQGIFDTFGNSCLSSRCPGLTELSLSCVHCKDIAIVETIEGLPFLRLIDIRADSVDNALVSALQSLESVRLTSSHAERLAPLVGRSVTFVLWIRDVGKVPKLPRLQYMGVRMCDPRSDLFREAVLCLPDLRALTLDFGVHRLNAAAEFSLAKESNRIVRIISNIPGLEELSLEGNLVEHVSDKELQAVCRLLGRRLKVFRIILQVVPMDSGSPQERLVMLLEALGKFNPCLREFTIAMLFYGERRQKQLSNEQEQDSRAMVKSALDVFERRLPGTLYFGFDDLVKYMFRHEIGNQRNN